MLDVEKISGGADGGPLGLPATMRAALERERPNVSPHNRCPEFGHSMHTDLRHALDTAYERMSRPEPSPAAFASSYALCLGMIMGGRTCGGMSKDEVAVERARLSMLATLYEILLGVRSDLGR